MRQSVDMVGEKFSRLTVLSSFGRYRRSSGHGVVQFICQCDCGTLTIATASNLQRKNTRSCGCIHDEVRRESRTASIARGKLTASHLKTRLVYDQDSGLFYWKEPGKHNSYSEGDVAGTIRKTTIGYRVISIDGKEYLAHRLAWLYMTGEWPTREIDHKNRERADNSWNNLREATHAQNLANRPRSKGKKLPKGVYFLRRNSSLKRPYRAAIEIRGKCISLGNFSTPEEAGAAYQVASQLHYGEFSHDDVNHDSQSSSDGALP